MSELSFAKSFLTTLDSRPSKISSDHVEDPHTYPPRGAYILPKMARPMTKRQKLSPGQERSLSVALKSSRNPPLDMVLKSQSLLTSILDLKTEVSTQASIPVEKIRILYKKKPVGDAKVLKDLVSEEDTTLELSVMVMGGAASVMTTQTGADGDFAAPVAQGLSGKDVLVTEDFWKDLKSYLTQRLRDEGEGERLHGMFKSAYESNSNKL